MASACKPPTIRDMQEADIAWLGGLLEGEGSFLTWKEKREGTRTRPNVVRIQMGSTDRDVLERAAAVTGLGRVRAVAPQHNKLGGKPFWVWSVQAKADVRKLTQRLLPWLGERRTVQARAILDATANLNIRPRGVCLNGHRIAGDNRVRTGPGTYACRTCANERRRASR